MNFISGRPLGYPRKMLRPIQALSLLVLLTTSGCADGTGESSESTTNVSTTNDSTASDSGGGGISQTDACRHYLECVAETSPAAVGPLLETYGPTGTCWESTAEVAELCDSACEDALATTAAAYPDAKACQEITTGESREGQYVLAVELITNGGPVFFHAVVTSADDAHASIALQSYVQEDFVPTSMLTPDGPFVLEATIDGDGAFTTAPVTVSVPGSAQPIGNDMVLDLSLVGVFESSDTFCGDALGEITNPLTAPIDGSTFAATRIADATALPAEIPSSCGG